MDSPTPLCSQPAAASPTLATAGTVLPHDDTQSTQLAHRASHLTLSTQAPWPTTPAAAVSPVTPPPAEPPFPAPKRTRACSACCAASDSTPPPPQRPRQASAPIGPLLPLPATAPSTSTPGPAADAQPAPLVSPPQTPCGHSSDRGEHSACGVGDAAYPQVMDWHQPVLAARDGLVASSTPISGPEYEDHAVLSAGRDARVTLAVLPNEVLLHVLGFLDVSDLLATSRVSSCLLMLIHTGRGLLF